MVTRGGARNAAARATRPREGGRNTENLSEDGRGARTEREGRRLAAAFDTDGNDVLREVFDREPRAAFGSGAIERMDHETLVGRML